MSSTAREVRAAMAPTGGPNGGEAASLVESAMLLRWRAPELALLLADRAVTAAQDDAMAVLRADHIAVFALNRLGRYGEAAHRLFPAIRDGGTPQGLRHELHVELAHCAAALGEPATALGAVRVVLAAGDDVAPVLRGGALVAVAEASAALRRGDLVASALEEADELYREDPGLDHDTALLLRAAVRATDAAYHRSRGEAAAAEAKAREGRELLASLADPDHDSGEVSARLMLELTLSLLFRGAGEAALQEVRPLLRRPVRAAAAGAVGRLRLALATQVHLAEGRHEPALTLLADAVEGAQRYGVDAVLAECLEGLSHVHEARDEFADALHCMRAARAAEGRHRRDVEAARATLLDNCGSARREEAHLIGQVAALLGNAGAGSPGLDADTGPLPIEIMAEPPAHQVAEVKSAQVQSRGSGVAEPDVQTEVAEVQVAGPDVVETVDEEGVAVARSAEVQKPASVDISLVAPSAAAAQPVDRKAVAQPVIEGADAAPAAESGGRDPWQSRARHRRGTAGTLLSVSDLLPASALSAGRSGRRRAEEPGEDRMEEEMDTAEVPQRADGGSDEGSAVRRKATDTPEGSSASALTYPVLVPPPVESSEAVEDAVTGGIPEEDPADETDETDVVSAAHREVPVFGPPPAPTPRALEWEPVDGEPAEPAATSQMGLGDLLAEALAAYQESRDVHADSRSTALPRTDGRGPTEETNRDLSGYGAGGTRWATGLALAPNASDPGPSDSRAGEPSQRQTDPAE
ncbi:MAG: hypothetical protein JO287_01580, partial [Pseudonocardiales bacterium]|nr:hypothetical protein [Pseudonocardiales bacterium]